MKSASTLSINSSSNDSSLLLMIFSGGDDGNDTREDADGVSAGGGNLAVRVATGFGLYTLALLTCVGNGMVIQAIRTEKRLRKVSNLFIMSLAVADLVVGVFVMPISAVYVLTDRWYLGDWMCDAWLSIDYCASTASIFNLFVLSLDRYWSITSPLKYLRRRTKKRAFLMIAAAWALSFLWILPVTGWNRMFGLPEHVYNSSEVCDTDFADNIAFKVTTAVANFYVPTLSMLYIYGRIFCTIRQRGRNDLGEVRAATSTRRMTPQPVATVPLDQTTVVSDNADTASLQTTEVGVTDPSAEEQQQRKKRRFKMWWCARHTPSEVSTSSLQQRAPRVASSGRLVDYYESLTLLELHNIGGEAGGGTSHYENVRVNVEYIEGGAVQEEATRNGNVANNSSPKETSMPLRGMLRSLSSNATGSNGQSSTSSTLIPIKERKAARQLGVIMAAFIVCWLPYFIVFMVVAGCHDCVDATLFKVTLWLGYVNSTLNPVLYPLCNANFRRAFAKMLAKSCCRTSHPQHRTHPLPSSGSVMAAHQLSSRY